MLKYLIIWLLPQFKHLSLHFQLNLKNVQNMAQKMVPSSSLCLYVLRPNNVLTSHTCPATLLHPSPNSFANDFTYTYLNCSLTKLKHSAVLPCPYPYFDHPLKVSCKILSQCPLYSISYTYHHSTLSLSLLWSFSKGLLRDSVPSLALFNLYLSSSIRLTHSTAL